MMFWAGFCIGFAAATLAALIVCAVASHAVAYREEESSLAAPPDMQAREAGL